MTWILVSDSASSSSQSTIWDMLQQAKVRRVCRNPCPGRQRQGWFSTRISQPFLLAGAGGSEPIGFNSQEQGEWVPGLQPAEGRQASVGGVSGRGGPRGTWQPPQMLCWGGTHQFSICSSPSCAASSPGTLSAQQTHVWLQEPCRSHQGTVTRPTPSPSGPGGHRGALPPPPELDLVLFSSEQWLSNHSSRCARRSALSCQKQREPWRRDRGVQRPRSWHGHSVAEAGSFRGCRREGFSSQGVFNPKVSLSSQTLPWGTAALSPRIPTCGSGSLAAAGGVDADDGRCPATPDSVRLKNLAVLSLTCKGNEAAVNWGPCVASPPPTLPWREILGKPPGI